MKLKKIKVVLGYNDGKLKFANVKYSNNWLNSRTGVKLETVAGTEDKDFRITFDSNIEWDDGCSDLRGIKKGNPLLRKGQVLMEIKVSNAFPRKLSDKLSELEIFPTSFSKYGAGYADMMKRTAVRIPRTDPASQLSEWNRQRMKGEMAYV